MIETVFSKIAEFNGDCDQCAAMLIAQAEAVHGKEARRHFTQRLHLALTIIDGRVADAPAKQGAERTQTLKANFETNVCNAQSPRPKQFLCLFDAPID